MSASASASIGRESGRKVGQIRRCHRPALLRKCASLLKKSWKNWDKRNGCHRLACAGGFVAVR